MGWSEEERCKEKLGKGSIVCALAYLGVKHGSWDSVWLFEKLCLVKKPLRTAGSYTKGVHFTRNWDAY